MRFFHYSIQYILLFLQFFSFSYENCLIKTHNFYLIPLIKEESLDKLYGLHKYDYNLILETDPFSDNDNYHMILSVNFPINVDIDLNPEIIYKFESTNKFCLRDLIRESAGRQNNIQGKISEYNSEIQIFQKIWIKVENVLLFKNVEIYDNKNKYFLITEFSEKDKNKKKFLLMKKMSNNLDYQFFQIIRVNLTNNLETDCLNDDEKNLKIGTEFTIRNENSMLREGINYESFVLGESSGGSYSLKNIENLICLIYENNKYGNKCFSTKDINNDLDINN